MSQPRIILARHGTPAWDFRTAIPGYGLCTWLEGEFEAALEAVQRPPPSAELERLVHSAGCLIASSLRRSIESARFIAPTVVPLIDERFREPSLPCAIRSRLRLRPRIWTSLARVPWFLGWSPEVETFRAARRRAAEASHVLVACAEAHGSVALIGHALMNVLIAARLRAMGWTGPRLPPPRHWGFGVYVHKGKEEV